MRKNGFMKSGLLLNLIYVLLLALFFLIDISLPWAIGSILYTIVILLVFLEARREKIFYIVSAVTIFTLTGVILTMPFQDRLRYLTNHMLVIGIFWAVAFAGLQFKKRQELNAFLASIVDSSNDVIIGKSLEGTIRTWNKAAEMCLGYKPEEVVGRPSTLIIPADKLQGMFELYEKVRNKEYIHHHETTRRAKDGRLIPISLSLSPVLDVAGNVVGFSSIARDISKEIEARENEKKFNALINKEKQRLEEVLVLDEGASSILHPDKLIDFIVQNTATVLGAGRCSLMLLDKNNNELVMKGCQGLDEEMAGKIIKLGEPIAGIIVQNGRPVLVEDIEADEHFARPPRPFYKTRSFISCPIRFKDEVIGLLNVADKKSISDGGVFSELDLKILVMIARQTAVALENSRLYREVNYLTLADPLTGINNFRSFTGELEQEIPRSKRYGRPLNLMMIDIDNFRSYNDLYGSAEGDRLLKLTAGVFTGSVRQVDTVCRYAGDEFAIILPEIDQTNARKVAEKLLSKIQSIESVRKVSVSIGLAAYRNNFDRLEFVKKADLALKEAKKMGGNCVYAL